MESLFKNRRNGDYDTDVMEKKAPAFRKLPEFLEGDNDHSDTNIFAKDLEIFDTFYKSLPIGKLLIAKTILALDIDVDKVRWLIVRRAGKSIQVKSCGIKTFQSNETDRFRVLQLTLEELRSKILKPGMLVYVSFFSPDMNIRQITFPKMRKKADLEKAIFIQNQTDLPNFNENSYWTYQIVGEFEEDEVTRCNVLVTVVSNEIVKKYLEVLEKAGYKPERLLPRPTALSSAYQEMVKNPLKDLVIDISYDFTQICFLNHKRLEYIRNVGIGAYNLEIAIRSEKQNGNNNKNIEQLLSRQLNDIGEQPQNEIRKRLLKRIIEIQNKQIPVLQMFLSEILRTIEYFHENGVEIDRIFLTGYGIKKEGLLPYLRKRLQQPVYVLAPQFSYSTEKSLDFGEFFAAMGTALHNTKDFNLVPDEYRARQKYRQLNVVLVLIIILLGILAGVVTKYQLETIESKENLLQQYDVQYKQLNPIERIYDSFRSQIEAVMKERTMLQQAVKEAPPLLEVLKLFSNEVPREIVLQSLFFGKYKQTDRRKPVTKIKQQQGKSPKYRYQIILSGIIRSDFLMGDVILINFINRLQNLKYFKDIRLTRKEKNQKKKLLRFDLMLFF